MRFVNETGRSQKFVLGVTPEERRVAQASGQRGARGVTLVELLVTLAIVALISGLAFASTGMIEATRLRGSAMMISSAVRVAYAHANATSRAVRIVFDFEQRSVAIEEASGRMALAKNDITGGAEAATEAERKAQAEAEALLKGPQPARARFSSAKIRGFGESSTPMRTLETGIRFAQIETQHDEIAETTGRAYLYFWPGGQTERAAIQLLKGGAAVEPRPEDVITLLVSPLTGKTSVKRGRVAMPRPRDDAEESERADTGGF